MPFPNMTERKTIMNPDISSMSSFRYTPLPNIQGNIRVLILSPGVHDAPVEGYLEMIGLGSRNDYEPTRKFEVKIHDGNRSGILKTTASLYGALQRFRYRDRQHRLWADQVCINQDDTNERSQQVQLMAKVYQSVAHVLVWLGPDEKSIARSALKLVLELDETFQTAERARRFHIEQTENLPLYLGDRWVPLNHLTSLLWFKRGWIVQEIGFQASATMVWGDTELGWMVLHRVCDKLSPYQYFRSTFNVRTADIKYAYQRFVEPPLTSYHANRFCFIYELHRAREQKVSDPRDSVFAFLGHFSVRAGGPMFANIKANYRMTVEQVYTDVAIRTLTDDMNEGSARKDRNTALITLEAVQHLTLPSSYEYDSECRSFSRHVGGTGLPSWVPDWRSSLGFVMSEPIHPRRAQVDTTPKLSIDRELSILSICGIRIDKIARCSDPLRNGDFQQTASTCKLGELPVRALWHSISDKKQFNLEEKYVSGESRLFAFMQTLSNGCIQNASREGSGGKPYSDIPESTWLAHEAGYLAQVVSDTGELNVEVQEKAKSAEAKDGYLKWGRAANGASRNRIFAIIAAGYFVLGSKVMRPGDVVCVFFWGKMPFVVRPWGERFLLVGECYVHGLMNGEAVDLLSKGEAEDETFDIV